MFLAFVCGVTLAAFGAFCGVVASDKGRNVPLWAILGFLTGPIALAALVFLRDVPDGSTAPCEGCGRPIPAETALCPHCGRIRAG